MTELVYTSIIKLCKLGFRALGQDISISGLEHIPATGPALLAVNHVGYVDFIYGGFAPDRLLNEIPGVSNVTPKGALYCFPRLDPEMYAIDDDQQFVIDLLRAKKILVTHGTGFNWFEPDHFRLVTLPDLETLTEAIHRIGDFLATQR